MALMERVATLLRANINDLMDRAEDPEKMLKQLLLDMENQMIQVKTQVAIALADQHLLERKVEEQKQATANWQRKAELAVSKGDDALARAALERALSHESVLDAFRAQVSDQAAEAEALRATYAKLQGKLAETRAQCELLIAKHRRARMLSAATDARAAAENGGAAAGRGHAVNRLQSRIEQAEAKNQAMKSIGAADSLEERLEQLEKDDRVEQLLADLKSKQQRLLPTG
ncbi:MAG TPA: PspA/IM30 family protein [Acidobacteriaceae bacterium]|nr:PspA/IM30 family protein [Acidobacteriaceae bacterium]